MVHINIFNFFNYTIIIRYILVDIEKQINVMPLYINILITLRNLGE